MNSFSFTFSGKHFICPSILNDSFAGQSHLGCRSLLSITLIACCQLLVACKVSFEKSAGSLMGTPLQVTLCFSLASCKIFSLSLTLGILIMMCLGVGLVESNLIGTLCFLDWYVYFLCQIREGFFHYFFKQISSFLLFLFFFWHLYDVNVGPLEVVPKAAYTIHIFLDSFFLLFRLVVFCFLMFQIIDLILGFIHSTFVSL